MRYDDRAARAQATYDPMLDGVSIIVAPDRDSLVHWGKAQIVRHGDNEAAMEAPREAYLRVREDVARAMYEALGRYFGGDATDARRLRQDYEDERKRVDKFIDAAIARST